MRRLRRARDPPRRGGEVSDTPAGVARGDRSMARARRGLAGEVLREEHNDSDVYDGWCACGGPMVEPQDARRLGRHCAICGVPELPTIELKAIVDGNDIRLSLDDLRALVLTGRWPEP